MTSQSRISLSKFILSTSIISSSLKNYNIAKVYHLFVQYGFYFIDDIILNNLELFLVDPSIIETGILKLQQELGPDYVKKIGMDMRYLEKLYQD